MKLYVGLKEKAKPTIFESEREPGKETYPQYDISARVGLANFGTA